MGVGRAETRSIRFKAGASGFLCEGVCDYQEWSQKAIIYVSSSLSAFKKKPSLKVPQSPPSTNTPIRNICTITFRPSQ